MNYRELYSISIHPSLADSLDTGTSLSDRGRPVSTTVSIVSSDVELDKGEEEEAWNVDEEAIRSRDPGRAPRVHR